MITGIFVDTREPDWVQHLTFGGLPTMATYLEHGDVMAATDDNQVILVERKTPNDFLSSLRDGRLLPQLAEMLDQTRWSYLVITGEFLRGSEGKTIADGRDTGWSWTAVQGALLTIQEMGIFITYAAGDNDFEACVIRLGARDRKEELLLEPPKLPRVMSAAEAIVASLPGIGTDRLKIVLEYCSTPAWALVALTDLDTEIPGIPRNVKIKVREALKLESNKQIAIISDDNGNNKIVIEELGAQ